MALTTVPANGDLCNWLNLLSTGDIVLATDPADYAPLSLCALGTAILAEPETADPVYKFAVIDTDDSCLKWKSQPPTPVYDSSLMKPLILTKEEAFQWPNVDDGVTYSNKCKIDLLPADFPVAMKLIVHYTILAGGANGSESCPWDARGPVAGVVSDLTTDTMELVPTNNSGNEFPVRDAHFTAVLDVAAGAPGSTYLAITFTGFAHIFNPYVQVRIVAYAFKA